MALKKACQGIYLLPQLLEKSTVLEVVLDNDVSDSIEYKLHIIGVRSTREMRVNLLGILPLVEVLELVLYVHRGIFERVAT